MDKGLEEGRAAKDIMLKKGYERILGWKEGKRLKCDCCRVRSVGQLSKCEVKRMRMWM